MAITDTKKAVGDLGLVRVVKRPLVLHTTVTYRVPESFNKGLLPSGVKGFLGADAIYHLSNSIGVYGGPNGDEESRHSHLTLSMNPTDLDSKPYWELSLSGEGPDLDSGEIILLKKSFLTETNVSNANPDYLERHWQSPARHLFYDIRAKLEDDFVRGRPLDRSLLDNSYLRH